MPGQLTVEITGQATPLLKSLQQTDAAVAKLGTTANKSFTAAADAAQNFDRQVTAVGKGADKSMRAVQGASANMAAQFQDIAVQAQSGTASMTIALQQGTQLAAVMQGLATGGGGLRALGGALLSVVNPISLITIGLVYAGAELAKFLFKANEVKELKLEDAFKEIDAVLTQVAKDFPGATKGVEEFHKGYAESLADLQGAVTTATTAIISEQNKLFNKMAQTGEGEKLFDIKAEDAKPAVDALNALSLAASDNILTQQELQTWQEATLQLMLSSTSATSAYVQQILFAADALKQFTDPTVAAVMAQILNMMATGGDISVLVQQLNEIARSGATQAMRDQAAAAAQMLSTVTAATAKLGNVKTDLDSYTGSLGAAVARTAELASTTDTGLNTAIRQFAVDMVNGKTSVADFVTQLQAVAAATPNEALRTMINNVIAAVQEIWKIVPAYNAATGAANTFAGAAAAAAATAAFAAGAARAGALAMAADMTSAASQLETMVQGHVNALKDERQMLRETTAAAQQKAVSIEQAIHLSEQEAKGLDAIAEKERRIEAARAAAAAKSKAKGGGGAAGPAGVVGGVDVSETQLKQWSRTMQETLDPTMKLREEQEKLALAIQKGVFPAELQAAALAKLQQQYGGAATKAFDLQKTFGTMMQQWGDQVASSLASAIVNGEDLGEVFKKLLLQLAEMALQMLVLKPLMGNIMAGFGIAPAAASTGVAANSNLRYPTPGRLGVRSATVGGTTTNSSSMGGLTINFNGAGGGDVAANGKRAKAMGERVRDVVQREMIRQSRPGGLMWSGGR